MQINEEFWGGASESQTWVPGVTITNYNMLDAFNQTEDVTWTLPLNEELDTSICPWAINKDADILKLAYPISYRIDPDNSYDSATPKFYPVHDYESEMSGIPIYFVVPEYAGGGANGFNWYARNGNAIAYIQPTTSTKYRDMIYPVRDFDYSKLCVSLTIVHTDNTTATDSVSSSTFDSYFSAANAEWRTTNPVVGLCFRIYGRGWDSKNPDRWQGGNPTSGHQMLMNTMGRKRPCEIAPLDATVGYNNDFKDDFMTIVNGDAWGGLAIGAWGNKYGGNGAAYVLSDSGWALSYEQGAAAELAVSADDHPSPRVPMLEGEDNTHWTIYSKYQAGSKAVYFKTILDASTFANEDELKAYILKQAAYLGMWIYTKGTPTGDPGSDEHWYLGEIGSDGVTTGNYRQGSATSELDNSTWENPWDSSGWNGRPVDPDPTDWDEDLQTVTHMISLDQNIGCMDYLMSGHALAELIRVLSWYKVAEAKKDINEGTCVTLFGTTDPLECIQSIIAYPYDLSMIWTGDGTGSALPVTGTYMSDTQGVYCGLTELVVNQGEPSSDTWYYLYTPYNSILQINWNTSLAIYHPKPIPYFDRYKSFLSYEPYCDAELYIPFCGSVKIDPQVFVGHDIKVGYNVSVSEGSCRADIYRDNLVVDSITGNMGAQIGLSSADIIAKVNAVQQANATISAQKANLAKSLAGFGIAAAATVATGGTGAPLAASLGSSALGATASAVSAHQSIEMAEYQIKQAEVPFHKLTTGHGFLVLASEDGVRLNVYRPTCLPGYTRTDWGDYGHTTGFACLKNDVLSNYHGLTVCSSVDLAGTACTSKEAEMIKSALKTGVYLP